MKKSIPVRVLTALGGLALLAGGAAVVAEGFFAVPVMATLGGLMAHQNGWAVLGRIVAALALALLGVMAVVCALPPKAPKQTGSIMQKGEDGSFGITVGAIRKMVLACAEKHPEITHAEVDVREVRDGVVILMDVEQVGGVSIPLSVARLQKQVRQYVNGRTGLDVVEVRVMVDNQSDAHVASEFEVEDRIVPSAPVHAADYAPARAVPEEPLAEQLRQMAEATAQPMADHAHAQEERPADAPLIPADTAELDLDALLPEAPAPVPVMTDEAEKPLHQRVFGAEEMPLTVPVPPEMLMEAPPAEAVAEPAPAHQQAPAAGPEAPQEDWTAPSMQAAADEVLDSPVEDAAPVDAEEAPAEQPVTDEEQPVLM